MNILVYDDFMSLIFPAIPKTIPINFPSSNEEFKTIDNGTLNLLGDPGLKVVQIDSVWPELFASWAKPGSVPGKLAIEFFNRYKKNKKPIRLIITKLRGLQWINMLVSIEDFTYVLDKNASIIRYSLTFKEYKKVI